MEELDWINAKNIGVLPKPIEPKVDEIISQVLGFKVYQSDPRLLNLVVKFKRMKKNDEETDDFLNNPQFIKELRETFNKSL